VRYVGRVHEQPSHNLAVRRLPIHIGHDGYSPAALAAKRGRNRRLLEADLAEHPDDAYLCYQIGKDAAVYDEHELAENFFSRALPLAEEHAPWRCDLVARRLFGLKRLGRHAQALKLATVEQIVCAESPDVFFALGDVLLDWAVNDPAQAAPLLAKAETAWLRCLAIGERPEIVVMSKSELPDAAEIRGRFSEEIGREVIGVSAVTGQGLDLLLWAVVAELDRRKETA
jgi:hypothetical protein